MKNIKIMVTWIIWSFLWWTLLFILALRIRIFIFGARGGTFTSDEIKKGKKSKERFMLGWSQDQIWFLRSRRAFWDLAGLRGEGDREDFNAVGFGLDSDLRLTLAFFGSLSESDTIGSPLIAHSICFIAFINPFRFFFPGRWSFEPS